MPKQVEHTIELRINRPIATSEWLSAGMCLTYSEVITCADPSNEAAHRLLKDARRHLASMVQPARQEHPPVTLHCERAQRYFEVAGFIAEACNVTRTSLTETETNLVRYAIALAVQAAP
jgi:hypothetical protein